MSNANIKVNAPDDMDVSMCGPEDLPSGARPLGTGETKVEIDMDDEEAPSKFNTTDAILAEMSRIIKRSKATDMVELKASNINDYNNRMDAEFFDFSMAFPTFFRKVIAGLTYDDMKQIAEMLYMLKKINNKEVDMKEGEEILGRKLAKKYIDPVLRQQGKSLDYDKIYRK